MQLIAMLLVLLLCVAVLILSVFVGLIVGGITAVFISDTPWKRRLVLSTKCALPFFFLALIVFPFVLWRVHVQKVSLPGTCVLPNGYKLMMIDTSSPAWVYNPRNEFQKSSVNWQKESVDGVRTLQVADRYVLGGRDNRGFRASGRVEQGSVSYFLLDTKTDKLVTMLSYEQLQNIASGLGIPLRLKDAYSVYESNGFMRFARFPPFSASLASLALMCLLARWVLQLRRFRSADISSH